MSECDVMTQCSGREGFVFKHSLIERVPAREMRRGAARSAVVVFDTSAHCPTARQAVLLLMPLLLQRGSWAAACRC